MQDILEAVLNDPGTEQSAHEVLRQELDDATRLDRLIPLHEHLCQLDARTRFAPAMAASGLDPTDLAALQASPAYGALIAVLRRADHANFNVPDLLRQAGSQASLTGANDLAAVLHARVERLMSRYTRKAVEPLPAIAGLVTPTQDLSDPTLSAPLRELEAQIARRADWLEATAQHEMPPWHRAVQRENIDRQVLAHRELVREIACYREPYGITGPTPLGNVPSANSGSQRQHHQRLTALLTDASPSATSSDNRSGITEGRQEADSSPLITDA